MLLLPEDPAVLHNQVAANIPFQPLVDFHLVEEVQMNRLVADYMEDFHRRSSWGSEEGMT